MKRLVSILLVALMVFLVLAPATSAMAASKKQKVTITAKDTCTGKSLSNVTIAVKSIKKVNGKTSWKTVTNVKTGSNGKAEASLEAGDYKLVVTSAPAGHVSMEDKKFTVKSKAVSVTTDVLPTFTCKITVLDSNGKPVSGAKVYIGIANAKTNSKGIATIKNVIYGKNEVIVETKIGKKVYMAYDKNMTIKGAERSTQNKTIKLPAKSKWQQIAIGYSESASPCTGFSTSVSTSTNIGVSTGFSSGSGSGKTKPNTGSSTSVSTSTNIGVSAGFSSGSSSGTNKPSTGYSTSVSTSTNVGVSTGFSSGSSCGTTKPNTGSSISVGVSNSK